MSSYSIYNIISGMCIGALIATWIYNWLMQRQERRHRDEIRRMQRDLVMEIKSTHKLS